MIQREFQFVHVVPNDAINGGNIAQPSQRHDKVGPHVAGVLGTVGGTIVQHERGRPVFNQRVLLLRRKQHNGDAKLLRQNPQVQVRHVMKRVHDEVIGSGRQHRAVCRQMLVVIHQLHPVGSHEVAILGNQDGFQLAHGNDYIFRPFFPQYG